VAGDPSLSNGEKLVLRQAPCFDRLSMIQNNPVILSLSKGDKLHASTSSMLRQAPCFDKLSMTKHNPVTLSLSKPSP
jgi:hypothetical protein